MTEHIHTDECRAILVDAVIESARLVVVRHELDAGERESGQPTHLGVASRYAAHGLTLELMALVRQYEEQFEGIPAAVDSAIRDTVTAFESFLRVQSMYILAPEERQDRARGALRESELMLASETATLIARIEVWLSGVIFSIVTDQWMEASAIAASGDLLN